ncbi:uncharacterized protein EAF02_009068 [Botrytis sinoallii]|uniref:uncharacterized protein n=1 Tax=Botrytis sinoallii TaxID=1463999 RepID=UPI001902B475|nr:uncharacterized protein EAF02_009068 [Botrytis sinoallii]KAF7871963.1 hypothetical protein EAF02_009068 [Botrytis sinoallii]
MDRMKVVESRRDEKEGIEELYFVAGLLLVASRTDQMAHWSNLNGANALVASSFEICLQCLSRILIGKLDAVSAEIEKGCVKVKFCEGDLKPFNLINIYDYLPSLQTTEAFAVFDMPENASVR